jgi:hypothetical protein
VLVEENCFVLKKKEDAAEFEKLEQQLHSFLAEISELSKKKPNDPLNKFKLKFINATLDKVNKLLDDYRPFEDFEQFDVDALPTNSDAVVILAQYCGAVYRFREENSKDARGNWYWIINGKVSDIYSGRPDRFKYRPK